MICPKCGKECYAVYGMHDEIISHCCNVPLQQESKVEETNASNNDQK